MKFRDRTLLLLRARWIRITVADAGQPPVAVPRSAALIAASSACLEGEVSWAQALAVFAFARLLSAIPLTPGGLGVVESR